MAERIVDINNRDEFVEALVALITSDGCHTRHKSGCLAPNCRECIDRFFNVHSHLLPEIDVAPVVHGHWLNTSRDYLAGTCSICGCEPLLPPFRATPYAYCPNCGAKMDGKED